MNTSDNSDVPSRYGVTAIPTFLVIKKGEVAAQFRGQMAYDKLKAAIAPHVG